MSSQSWFGNGAIAAPQDGYVLVRRFTLKTSNAAFRAAALLREGSISVRFLCVMLFDRYVKFFLAGSRMVLGDGTHMSAAPPLLGRVSETAYEAISVAAMTTFAGPRSWR